MNAEQQILECADDRGLIRVDGDLLRSQCVRLVKQGLLIELSRYVFSLPEGG